MADANLVQVAYIRETTWNVMPTITPMLELPIVSGAMPHGQNEVRSAVIRSDAQIANGKRVGIQPGASYNIEFVATTYDPFFRAALRADADWSTAVNVTGVDISAQASTNTLNKVGAGINTNVSVGQWVYVSGFTTAANNGWKQITAAGANSLTVGNDSLSDEAAGDTVQIKGQYLRNGSDLESFTFQHEYTDQTNRYHRETGCRINGMGLTLEPEAIINGTLGFDGGQRTQESACGGDTTVTDAADNDVQSEVAGFQNLWINSTAITYDILRLGFNVGVTNRRFKGLGSLPSTRISQNAPVFNGNIGCLLEDDTWGLDTYYEDYTAFALAFDLDMGSSDYYHFEFPQIHMTDEPMSIGGIDTDVEFDFTWEAEPGGTYAAGVEHTCQICRSI